MSVKSGVPVVSVEQYLRTSYPNPDREYRDGEIVERSLPDWLHAKTQMLLLLFFGNLRKKLSIFPGSELRVKLREGLYLIPDVAVYHLAEPSTEARKIPDNPPLIVVEIVSPEDRSEVREKLELFRGWGVPHVWLIDPHSRRMYTCDAGLTEVASLKVPELGLEVGAGDVFE